MNTTTTISQDSLPDWLAPAFPVTAEDRERIEPIIRAWNLLSDNFHKLSETDLLKAVVIELDGKRRHIIISRCASRFRTMRWEKEANSLESLLFKLDKDESHA